MRIERAERSRSPLSMTPLIDVIFLLLMFFMLSSTFTRFAQVEIDAGGRTGAATKAPDLLVRIEPDLWVVNGDAIRTGDALIHLTSLHAAGAATALLLIGQDTSSQTLVDAIETLRQAGLSVSVAR